MNNRHLIFILCFYYNFLSFSQVIENIQLPLPKGASYPFSQIEPSIAIRKDKPRYMIAGSVLNDYYYSKNGGKRWKSKSLESQFGVNGDPVVHVDKKGKFYYFHLSNPAYGYLDRIVCESSENIKGRWYSSSTPKNGSKAQDKQWVAECPITGNLYLTWTQFDKYNSNNPLDSSVILFSKSTDEGKSWSSPIRISKFAGDCLDDDNTVEGAVPTVGPNGEIYVCWSGPKGIMFNRSLDMGETWLPEEGFVSDQPMGWNYTIPGFYRSNGLPITKCDLSTKHPGRIYLNWSDQRNGIDNTDIWLVYSDDKGETWSSEIKVNQDNSEKHQFLTWMDIDQTNGNIFFVYYDRREHKNTSTDVYMSFSKDGGKTIEDIKISKDSFTPDENIFFGDYINIAVHDNVIRPIWPRMDAGKISLWVGLIGLD